MRIQFVSIRPRTVIGDLSSALPLAINVLCICWKYLRQTRKFPTLLRGTYTKHGPGSMDHLMDPVHGRPWTTPWTWSMDQVPWTTPNFQKEIAPVNFIWKFTEGQGMKNKDSYLLLTFLRVCLAKASCFGIHEWEDHELVLRYRRSSAFLAPIFSFQHFQIAIRSGRHLSPPSTPRLLDSIVNKNEPIYFINEVYPKRTNL